MSKCLFQRLVNISEYNVNSPINANTMKFLYLRLAKSILKNRKQNQKSTHILMDHLSCPFSHFPQHSQDICMEEAEVVY